MMSFSFIFIGIFDFGKTLLNLYLGTIPNYQLSSPSFELKFVPSLSDQMYFLIVGIEDIIVIASFVGTLMALKQRPSTEN